MGRRVLIVNTIGLDYEGITGVIRNYTAAMDRTGLELHFTAYADIKPALRDEFDAWGKVHTVRVRARDPLGYARDMMSLLRNRFDVIHIHGNSGTMLIEVILARLCGVRRVIVHSHNTTCRYKLLNALLKCPMKLLATELLACSDAAGRWLYGKSSYTVLNNAIDLEKYRFDPGMRARVRDEFGLTDEFVIGHSGRFDARKNQTFLVDAFREYLKKDPRAALILLSDGPDLETVRQKAEDIADRVIFAGRRADADRFYNAMDIFVMPSLWEGLPLVMLEAQANGLPVLGSDTITKEAFCTGRARSFSLDRGAEAWAEEIAAMRSADHGRCDDCAAVIGAKGYDIRREADTLRKIYLK